jgi:hypothetical protein
MQSKQKGGGSFDRPVPQYFVAFLFLLSKFRQPREIPIANECPSATNFLLSRMVNSVEPFREGAQADEHPSASASVSTN